MPPARLFSCEEYSAIMRLIRRCRISSGSDARDRRSARSASSGPLVWRGVAEGVMARGGCVGRVLPRPAGGGGEQSGAEPVRAVRALCSRGSGRARRERVRQEL